MSEFAIEVEGGKSVRLKTAGKYCDRNIVVTATGGGGDTDAAYQQGVEDGKQAEYDRFWDTYQQNGNRTYYTRAFTIAWTDEILKPKYTAKPTKAEYMFYESSIVNALANPEWLDLTECTTAENFARFSKIRECSLHIPACAYFDSGVRDCTALTKLTLTGIIENCRFISCFTNCNYLTELTLGGTVGQSIDLHWSPLSKDSILSCFSVLSDTATGQTATFKKTAAEAAFATDEWNALVATKPNWTITLA